jgi:hypothetical protein
MATSFLLPAFHSWYTLLQPTQRILYGENQKANTLASGPRVLRAAPCSTRVPNHFLRWGRRPRSSSVCSTDQAIVRLPDQGRRIQPEFVRNQSNITLIVGDDLASSAEPTQGLHELSVEIVPVGIDLQRAS